MCTTPKIYLKASFEHHKLDPPPLKEGSLLIDPSCIDLKLNLQKAIPGRFPAGLFGQTKCHHHHYLQEVKFQKMFFLLGIILRDSILLDHYSRVILIEKILFLQLLHGFKLFHLVNAFQNCFFYVRPFLLLSVKFFGFNGNFNAIDNGKMTKINKMAKKQFFGVQNGSQSV